MPVIDQARLTERITEMKQLADISFGQDYLTYETLLQFEEDSRSKIIEIRNQDDLAAFSLLKVYDIAEARHQGWFRNSLNLFSKIGWRKLTLVSPKYRQIGIGSQLVQHGIDWLDAQVDVSVSVGWIRSEQSGLTEVLKKNGYLRYGLVKDYWHEESITQGYHCAECGTPPCNCDAELLMRINPKHA